jgi:hypothetical protein
VVSPPDEVGLGKGACIFGFSEAFRRWNVEIGMIGTYVSSVALRFPVQVPRSSRDVQSTRLTTNRMSFHHGTHTILWKFLNDTGVTSPSRRS